MNFVPISLSEDLDSISQVARASFSSTSDSVLEEWFSFDEMRRMIELNRGMCIKAVDEYGNIRGLIYAQQENPINGKEGLEKWVISILAVKPDSVGSGIGTELLKSMEKYAKTKGATKLLLIQIKKMKK